MENNAENYRALPSLRPYVRVKEDKDVAALEAAALKWSKVGAENRLAYEIDWLGVPVIQTPEDLILMQELIYRIQPDVLVETGIAHGGSLIYYASIMELLGKGRVIGVDIEIRRHNRDVIEAHPLYKRIEMIEGSSIADETVEKVRAMVPADASVIVCLDSDHTKPHVLKELQLYQPFVKPGGYIVVSDTHTSRMAELGAADEKYIGNSPREAVDEFLTQTRDFEVDTSYNKLFISYSPNGYLKRVR